MRPLPVGALLLVACLPSWGGAAPIRVQEQPGPDGVAVLLHQVESALLAGSAEDYLALVAPGTDRAEAEAFAHSLFRPGITQSTIHERDRVSLKGAVAGEGLRLLVEGLIVRGRTARIVTWQFDVRRASDGSDRWFIAAQEQVSSLDGLHRLRLDTDRQFAARDLTISSVDFSLTLPRGRVFVAETPAGVTSLVLVGKGTARFSPAPAAERRRCGSLRAGIRSTRHSTSRWCDCTPRNMPNASRQGR